MKMVIATTLGIVWMFAFQPSTPVPGAAPGAWAAVTMSVADGESALGPCQLFPWLCP